MNNDGHSGNENADGLDTRSDAALWDLLGRADQPKPGPYFVRRVLCEVSLLGETPAARWWQPAALWQAFQRLPRLAFVAGTPAAAVLLLFLGLRGNFFDHPAPVPALASTPQYAGTAAPVPALVETVPAAQPAASVAEAALPEGISAQDVEVIAELDTLLKREQNRLWVEDTARF